MSTVELRKIEKHYGVYRALKAVDLSIDKGEFVVMVGPSGCGKSTLLKTIAGLEMVSSGQLLIGGRDVTRADPGDRGIAMVFQSYALYPHMTVAENMGFGLRMAHRPKADIAAAVARAARILRLDEQLGKLPKQLSGGQRQRVAIGRAITRSPEVFLFDEPLSNLDAALRTQMRVELSTLHASLGATMIYVTHDQVEAMTMATRIVVLNRGAIEQVGSPLDLYANPVNLFVAGFLGAPRMNFLPATVADHDGADTIVVLADGRRIALPALVAAPKAGDAVTLGLRPERLRPAGAGAVQLAGTVRLVEHLGRETILYADVDGLRTEGSDSGTGALTLQVADIVPFAAGAPVTVGFDPADAYLFAPDGRTLTSPKPVMPRP
jgi:multiple sugar transport system ATP-binding protein